MDSASAGIQQQRRQRHHQHREQQHDAERQRHVAARLRTVAAASPAARCFRIR